MSEKKEAIKQFMEHYQAFELAENGVPIKPPMIAIRDAFTEGYEALESQLATEKEKAGRLREALSFYGDGKNYDAFGNMQIFGDSGKRARQCLKEIEG
jgi:hypothetical protein